MNKFSALKLYLNQIKTGFQYTVLTCVGVVFVGYISISIDDPQLLFFSNTGFLTYSWTFFVGICLYIFSIQSLIFFVHYLWLRFTKFVFPDFDMEGVLSDAYQKD
jgi:hypothetical protein